MTLIRGRYEPIEVAGRGGQGKVLKALDRMHSRPVAIKIREDLSPDALLAETRTLLDLTPHAALPLVREDFFEGGRYHMVMDWIEGRSLEELLLEKGALALEDVTNYLKPVAEAIDHLHDHDPPVIHKDVKPSNILVNESEKVFLVDFGIASTTRETAGMGSGEYAAPEIASGKEVTPAADIFSLAATAFALLSGTPPRPGLRPSWREVPAERLASLEMSLTRALAFDPSRRPKSAIEFVTMLISGDTSPGNLRLSISPFIGRERELEEVARLVETERLVTIIGAGGLGKSRLADQVATMSRDSYPDGAWFVPLADVASPGLVGQTIAQTLGADYWGRTPMEALIDHLLTRKILLVIDNCEHLVEECAAVASDLLATSPGLHILATSRSPLGVEGELHWRLPTMEFPSSDESLGDLANYEAVQLFLDRARRVKAGFTLSERNAQDVAAICRELEGIPLAIELAAARVAMMTTGEILIRLKDRFELLSGSMRGSSPRRSSLRAAIDWSYEMLERPEAETFARLSVFSGGFTFEAAQAVTPEMESVFDHLVRLSGQSLITAEESDGITRFRMLETIRAYASDRLRESGTTLRTRSLHLEWFATLAEQLEEELGGPNQGEALNALEVEHDNFRAALRHALESSDVLGLRLAAALWRFWEVRGYFDEGREWVESLLGACSGVSPHLEARALRAAGDLALRQSDYEAASRFLTRASSLAREEGDLRLLGAVITSLAVTSGSQGLFNEERELYEEATSIWRELGHKRGLAVVLGNLGTLSWEQSDIDLAGGYFEESLGLRREMGDTHGIAASLNGLGLVAFARGNLDDAERFYDEAITVWDSLGFARGVAIATGNKAALALSRGDTESARRSYEESIEALREMNASSDLAESLHGLGEVARREENQGEASTHHRESLRLRNEIGDRRGIAESLEALGFLFAKNDQETAAMLLAAAERLRESISSPPNPQRRLEIEAVWLRLKPVDRSEKVPDLEDAIKKALAESRIK